METSLVVKYVDCQMRSASVRVSVTGSLPGFVLGRHDSFHNNRHYFLGVVVVDNLSYKVVECKEGGGYVAVSNASDAIKASIVEGLK